jgi:fatty-acyl-CoA synthase
MSRPETLTELLEGVAARRPEAVALVAPGVRMTYAAVASAARRVAEGLARQGVGPGDRVAVWLPNRPEYLVLHFALARLGACAVHVNTRFRAGEVAALLDRARPTALVTAWDFPPVDFPALLAEVAAETRAPLCLVIGLGPGGAREVAGLPVIAWEALLACPERARDDAAADAACLTFTTSGTTSGPKLVLHRQRSIAGHGHDVMRRIGTDAPGATLLGVLPFCGTFGLAAAMAALAGGAKIVCMDRFDPQAADALIRAEGVTHMVGGDDMLFRLAEAAAGRPYAPFAFTGFASFHPGAERIVEVGDALNLACRGVYGSSEMQALFALQDSADPARRRVGGGLLASPEARVRARDGADGAPGDHGELEFHGPSMFHCYLGDEAATARAMTPDGFFRSGDLGRLHADGRGFDFETRLGDALRLGGFLVGPEEIEAFLKRQPGVREAQVVGVAGGTVAVAFVQPEPGARLDEASLIEACRRDLARFKLPARILPIEAFPATESANGVKIQRARLREMAEDLMRRGEAAA